MRRLSLLMCAAAITLAGFSVAMPVHAQDPLPRAFAHDVLPGGVEPSDGASAVVVEGLCGGLGGASYDWHIVAQDTATDINAHRPTITEISPQGPADCGGATLQDYEDMIADIYTNVESSTTEAATWWGGFMLDEEPQDDFGWSDNPGVSAAFYEALNSFVHDLMGSAGGISYYYTELATPPGWWLGPAFTAIVGNSYPAPAIANEATLELTNDFQMSMHEAILSTWSVDPGYSINGLVYSATRVDGPPFAEWGMNLSNCWINYFAMPTAAQVCNDWDADGILNAKDTDGDNDGCPDVGEAPLGLDPLDPWDFYSVPLPALFAAANPVGLHPDNYVASEDGQAVRGYFKRGARIGSPDYVADLNWNNIEDGLEYDRTVLGPDESGPPDGVIAASDAQLAFAQFRAHFVC